MTRTIAILMLIAGGLAAKDLTQGERDRAMSELHASRKMVLDAAAGLSAKQWNYKESPERWSIAEIVDHLAVTEDFLFGIYQQVAAGPANANAKKVEGDEALLKMVRSRNQKVQAPEPAKPKKAFATPEAALKAFEERRVKTIAYVETTKDQDLRQKIVPNMNMDAYQVFLLLAAHGQRHVAQIEEVKAAAGFPKK
jgi:uncharacterized damage-inducible protein DinB